MSPLSPVYREESKLYLWDEREAPAANTAPFTLFETEPTVANTGPRFLESDLEPSGQPTVWTINTPGTYEGFKHNGTIKVTIDSGVILRDYVIDVPASAIQTDAIRFEHANANGNFVEYGRIRVAPIAQSPKISTCIRGRGFQTLRNDLSGAVDGALVWCSSGQPMQDTWFYGDYMHDFPKLVDPDQDDGFTHNDGVQWQGNIRGGIRGCAIWGGRTSCTIFTTAFGAYGSIEISDNWLYPHLTEGTGVNAAASISMDQLLVIRNRLAVAGNDHLRASTAQRVASRWGMSGTTGNTSGWTGTPSANHYPNGSVVPITNG